MRFVFLEQLQIAISETFDARFNRVFGYIATIKLDESAGADTPSCCQVVLKIPWRGGLAASENQDSSICPRVNSNTSSLCMERPTRAFRIGDLLSGFPEQSRSEYDSAQLTGWNHVSPALWKAISPTTFPSQFALRASAVFLLPQLAGDNVPIWPRF